MNRSVWLGKRLVISRTDNLGDVILTLPLLGYLKSKVPDLKIFFIGKKYTQPIIDQCIFVDQFLDRDTVIENPQLLNEVQADTIILIYPDQPLAKLAKQVKIKQRVSTAHRWYNWLYCNHRVNFSRVKSNLHESQLNFKLLKPFNFDVDINIDELAELYGIQPAKKDYPNLLAKDRFNLILHPKSKGSAREWPLNSYYKLVQSLPAESFKIFITGLKQEGDLIRDERPELLAHSNVTDLTGRFDLAELSSFISKADGLLACSTGVLHLAAALGISTLGLYAPMKPIHPGRWMPIGNKTKYLSLQKDCNDCRKSNNCACIQSITVSEVKHQFDVFLKKTSRLVDSYNIK